MPADPNPFVVEELANVPPGRALDLGTGEGRHAVWLATLGWHVTAVDFSVVGLAKGKRRAAGLGVDVAWLAADLVEYQPLPLFDLVLVSFVHFAPPARSHFLARAAGGLVPGGSVIVVGYDRSNGSAVGPGRHDLNLMSTPEEVAGDLSHAGLRIERADRQTILEAEDAGSSGTTGPPRPVIDVFVRAVRPVRP
jgi:SAM-dependent methyltransferase